MARTITKETTVYKFDELSDDAKETARDWWRECELSDPAWCDENQESMDSFCEHFGFQLDAYNSGLWGNNYADISPKDWNDGQSDCPLELSYVRLWKWLQNNYDLKELLSGNCPFTGYCFDEYPLDALREFMAKPDRRDFVELMGDCAYRWVMACREDLEWRLKDEQVDESILCNDYEFTEDGELYS